MSATSVNFVRGRPSAAPPGNFRRVDEPPSVTSITSGWRVRISLSSGGCSADGIRQQSIVEVIDEQRHGLHRTGFIGPDESRWAALDPARNAYTPGRGPLESMTRPPWLGTTEDVLIEGQAGIGLPRYPIELSTSPASTVTTSSVPVLTNSTPLTRTSPTMRLGVIRYTARMRRWG